MNPRKTLIGSLALAILMSSGAALAHKHDHDGHKHKHGRHDSQTALAQSKISAADAVARAEKDSGARAYNLDLDMHRGQAVYEIDLTGDKQEHEIRINAETGDIIARKSEHDDDQPRTANISLQEAITNAERELGGKVVDAELEGHGPGHHYDIKLIKEDGSRIHAEISGEDGKILQKMEKAPRHGGKGQNPPPAPPSKS